MNDSVAPPASAIKLGTGAGAKKNVYKVAAPEPVTGLRNEDLKEKAGTSRGL